MNIWQENGFKNRKEYLDFLADDFGVPKSVVYALASVLGASEDFDGLISELEDYCD